MVVGPGVSDTRAPDSYFLWPLLRTSISESVPSATLFPQPALLLFLALRVTSCLPLPLENKAKGTVVDESSLAGGIMYTAENNWI